MTGNTSASAARGRLALQIAVAVLAAFTLWPPQAGRAVPLLAPLEAGFTWSPGNPLVGTNAQFLSGASSSDGTIYWWKLCYGDGTCQGNSRAVTQSEQIGNCVFGSNWGVDTSHRFSAKKPYVVTLQVKAKRCPGFDDESRTFTATVTVV